MKTEIMGVLAKMKTGFSYVPERKVQRKQRQALFSNAQWQDDRQWAQAGTQEVLELQETLFLL